MSITNRIAVCVIAVQLGAVPSFAQTPQDPSFAGTRITFTAADVKGAMTVAEREDFDAMRRELKELQEDGRKLPEGSAGRRAVQSAFKAQKAEFERKFSAYRGLKGQSVMVYGSPFPTAEEVLGIVMMGRVTGGDGVLYPHWERDRSDAVNGSHSPPAEHEPGSPAGPEERAQVGVDAGGDRPNPSGEALTAEEHCIKIAGPRPARLGNAGKCKCSPPEQEVFGMPSCWWYRDNSRSP